MTRRKPLVDCDAEFIEDEARPAGVMFVCPACPRNSAGSCHSIVVPWMKALRDRLVPGYPLWTATGTDSLDTLTISPSIDATKAGTCSFHGWVTRGQVSW